MRYPTKPGPTEDEQALIATAGLCEEFITHRIWLELEKRMNAIVEDALDAMRGNQSSDAMVAHRLNLRWKEREWFRDNLILYVKGPIREKKQLLKEIEGENNVGSTIY